MPSTERRQQKESCPKRVTPTAATGDGGEARLGREYPHSGLLLGDCRAIVGDGGGQSPGVLKRVDRVIISLVRHKASRSETRQRDAM